MQAPDAPGEGEVEQLGQLRADLAGLPVDGVAAEEDQVEGPGVPQDGGQRTGRRQGVRAGESGVAGVEPGVGAPGHGLAQDVLRARWPERHHGAGPAGVAGQRDALGHGAAAVGVHLDADARADEPALHELQRFRQRHLLGQHGNAQRVTRGPGHPQRPSAAPAGLRGSDAPTRRRDGARVGGALGGDDLRAADGDRVEGADLLARGARGR